MPGKVTTPRVCQNCGKTFASLITMEKHLGKPRPFCSRKCSSEAQRTKVEQVCEHCGKAFRVWPSEVAKGWGRFCSRKCYNEIRVGVHIHGGPSERLYDMDGYVLLYRPDHPQANNTGHVREHRLVMEDMLGHPIPDGCVVHHEDRNVQNNDPANLRLLTRAEHARLHLTEKNPMSDPALRRKAIENRSKKRMERQASSSGSSLPDGS